MGRLKDFADLNVGKKPPVKAGTQHPDEKGGIFTKKVIAIVQKIREKWQNF